MAQDNWGQPGLRNLITDVPGLLVGQAHDLRARTGVTVLLPDPVPESPRDGRDIRAGWAWASLWP